MYRAHLVVGSAFLLLFLATGAYMLSRFPELYAEREEVRMMYRATHIYILMAALINLMTANFVESAAITMHAVVRFAASALLLISPFLLSVAFFVEPSAYLVERPISFWGVLALFIGVSAHTMLSVWALIARKRRASRDAL